MKIIISGSLAYDMIMDFPGYFNNMLRQLRERGVGDIENLKAIENSLAEPGKARALLREFRTKKEQQFGIPSEDPESASQGEPVSQSVH